MRFPALLLLAFFTAACQTSALGGSPGDGRPPFDSAHALVLLLDAPHDTARFTLRPDWAWVPAGRDTVLGFARVPAPDGRTAYGRVVADTLVWGLGRIVGDAGATLEMRGRIEADGRVRGCGRYRERDVGLVAGFILVPAALAAPHPSDVPVAVCRAGAGSR